MYKHYLITRFNLRNSNWVSDKNNNEVLTEDWHKNRFKLFTDFCFSSVASQTNNNFEWLVFFDSTTSEKYRKVITQLQEQMVNFVPIFVDGMEGFLPEIKSYLNNCKEKYIITSRIDNDDCVSKYYIDEVQKKFNKQDYMAFDFVNGYTLQIKPDIKIANRLDQFNPFITLIEKNDNPKSVWSVRHSHWKREKHITQIKHSKIWASIIHEENKINGFGGFGKVDVNSFLEDFQIDQLQANIIKKNAVPQSEWKLLSLKNAYRSYSNLYYKTLKKKLGVYKFK